VAADAELVLRVADALLELPAVGGRVVGFELRELGLRIVELLLRARSLSISPAGTASSTRAIARSSSTWKKPGPVANSSTFPSPRCTRVEPRLQHRHERCMTREHADLAGGRPAQSASRHHPRTPRLRA